MATDFIFQHGGIQGSWVWDQALAALRGRGGEERRGEERRGEERRGEERRGEAVGRCVTLDVPGCGAKRGRDASALPFDAIVADLVADIDASALSDAVLVGHSQAGSLLPRIVEARPGLFRRVVYISCIAPAPGDSVLVGTIGSEIREGELPEQAVMMDRFRDMFCNDMDDAQADAFLAKLGRDNWPLSAYAETGWRYDHLAAIPSSYILCLDDACVVPERQEISADRLQARRILRIDAGHQVMNSRPEALAELLLAEAGSPD